MIGDDVTVELFLDSSWVDITTYVRATEAEGITITFGVQGETGIADPSECRLTVNNRDGRFSTRNPEGPWFGFLKRNTPLRVTVDTEIRYVGEVSEFPARWDPSGTDVWVPLVASGVLRRLQRYAALQSAMRTFLPGVSTVTGYWPMEDQPGSSTFASGLPGGTPMTYTGTPGFASIEAGGGSAPVASVEGVHTVGFAEVAAGSTGFTLGFLLTMPTGGTADTAVLARVYTHGTAYIWDISYETGGFLRMRVYSPATVSLHTFRSNYGVDGTTQYVKLEVTDDGADVDYALSTSGVGTVSGTVTGAQATSPASVHIGPGSLLTGDVGVGHVVLASSPTALFSFDFNDALSGFSGESAEDRVERVCAEIGVVGFIVTNTSGGTADSTVMGPQPITDPLTVLRDVETADAGGILRDALNEMNEVVFTTRRARYNSGSGVLQLDYSAGHLSPPLTPTDDDQLLANDVIVTRTDGGSARATDVTSPLSSLDYPDGVGTYQKAITVNVETDGQLPDIASWLLALGTLDKQRFPELTVDLTANPSLTAQCDAVRPGNLVVVENLPDWASHSDVHLHALGWTEQITAARRTFTFKCVPADVHDVVRLDDAQYGRLDSDSTTTSEALDTTETGVDYTGDDWITTATHPSEFPFDIEIGGEVMTVTAATSSTFTVTRSVNGVVKSHLTGQPVRLHRPNRIAL